VWFAPQFILAREIRVNLERQGGGDDQFYNAIDVDETFTGEDYAVPSDDCPSSSSLAGGQSLMPRRGE